MLQRVMLRSGCVGTRGLCPVSRAVAQAAGRNRSSAVITRASKKHGASDLKVGATGLRVLA